MLESSLLVERVLYGVEHLLIDVGLRLVVNLVLIQPVLHLVGLVHLLGMWPPTNWFRNRLARLLLLLEQLPLVRAFVGATYF